MEGEPNVMLDMVVEDFLGDFFLEGEL